MGSILIYEVVRRRLERYKYSGAVPCICRNRASKERRKEEGTKERRKEREGRKKERKKEAESNEGIKKTKKEKKKKKHSKPQKKNFAQKLQLCSILICEVCGDEEKTFGARYIPPELCPVFAGKFVAQIIFFFKKRYYFLRSLQ